MGNFLAILELCGVFAVVAMTSPWGHPRLVGLGCVVVVWCVVGDPSGRLGLAPVTPRALNRRSQTGLGGWVVFVCVRVCVRAGCALVHLCQCAE